MESYKKLIIFFYNIIEYITLYMSSHVGEFINSIDSFSKNGIRVDNSDKQRTPQEIQSISSRLDKRHLHKLKQPIVDEQHVSQTIKNEILSYDLKGLQIKLKVLLSFHTQFVNGEEVPKPNFFINLKKLSLNNNCKSIKYASERSVIRKLFKLGYIQYAVLAKEDIQWCDWLLWNQETSKWSQIELKSNNDISLFDSNGDFLRLGTLSTKRELNRYLSKGIRIQKIAEILGFEDIKLLYFGKICPNAKKSLYKLDFDENGIQKYTEIINKI